MKIELCPGLGQPIVIVSLAAARVVHHSLVGPSLGVRMSNTVDIELANKVGKSIASHFPGIVDLVSPIFGAIAFNLGGARVAHGLAAWKANGGYEEIQQKLADEQFDVLDISAIDACLRSVMTTLDLCAAALFRIGGGEVAGQEKSVAGWQNPPDLHPELQAWIDSIKGSTAWAELRDRRNEVTHRCIPDVMTFIGGGEHQLVKIKYNDSCWTAEELTQYLVEYGSGQFNNLANKVIMLYPPQSS